MTHSDIRRVAWVTNGSYTGLLDPVLQNPAAYATKAHLVPEHVGGYRDQGDGLAGVALCGARVPSDSPDIVAFWLVGEKDTRSIPPCKHCARKS